MKLHIENQNFEGVVPANRIPFKIATNAKLFGILSDGIYKDKILAVIRELSCNAHDVHVETKNPKPFRIFVPNRLEPTFAVEDEGTGIDPAKIADIYWTYGESSKTKSNETIGALGLGSKSPFAYTKSSFVVKNRWKGKEHTYFCFINETGVPDGSEISAIATDKPDGITVELAARDEDIRAFRTRIGEFFKYWDKKPEFIGDDITVPTPEKVFVGTNWFYEKRDSYNSNALAIMGNVPYPLDIASVPNPSAALKFIASNSFVISFPLGDLSFQASREELSYEKATVDALEKAAKIVFAELKKAIAEEIVKDVKTPLQLMRRFKGMHSKIADRLKHTHVLQGKIMHFFEKQDKFQLPSGETFTAEELERNRVILDVKGASNLGIFIGNGLSSSGRWALKQARTVTMKLTTVKPDPKDAAKTISTDSTRTVSWFRPSTKPLLTTNAIAVSTMLATGWVLVTTSLSIETNGYGRLNFGDAAEKDEVRFIVNNYGPKGAQGFRNYAKKHFSSSKTFFIDADPYAKVADFGFAEIIELLKGTVFEGAEVVYLSSLPDFELPKAEPKVVVPGQKVIHGRGTTEVRMLIFKQDKDFDEKSVRVLSDVLTTPSIRRLSVYNRITISGCKMLYVISDKGTFAVDDRKVLDSTGDNLMAWLFAAGAFKDYVDASGDLRVIARKQEDIDYLVKRGADLKRLSDFVAGYVKQPAIDDAYKVVHRASTFFGDSLVTNFAANNIRKPLLVALGDGKGSLFVDMFNRVDTLVAAVKSKDKGIPLSYAVALYRGPFATNANTKYNDLTELNKRYPLLSMMNDLSYSRSYINTKQTEELVALRIKHLAYYIKAADQAYADEQLSNKKVA